MKLFANRYLLLEDAKFVRFVRRLFAFFVPDRQPSGRCGAGGEVALERSNLIACAGCYLLDFALCGLDVTGGANLDTASLDLFQYALVEFIQGKTPLLFSSTFHVSFLQ